MKRSGIYTRLAVSFAVVIPAISSAAAENRPPLLVSNCHAVDGDTLRCGSVRIRLVGIDAAEMPGHCRQGRDCAAGDPFAHRRALQALVKDQLRITPLKLDKYSRMIANVESVGGRNVSCAMLDAGATYRRDWDEASVVRSSCPSSTTR